MCGRQRRERASLCQFIPHVAMKTRHEVEARNHECIWVLQVAVRNPSTWAFCYFARCVSREMDQCYHTA